MMVVSWAAVVVWVVWVVVVPRGADGFGLLNCVGSISQGYSRYFLLHESD
ncbi:hypothetical protein [Pasteuria penetrans]|nr:hypothetical protein [Pasteuria penetrans]